MYLLRQNNPYRRHSTLWYHYRYHRGCMTFILFSSSTTHIRSIMIIFYGDYQVFLIFYKRYQHSFSLPFSKTPLEAFLRHSISKVISFIRVITDIASESLTELSRGIYDLPIIPHIRLSRRRPPDGNNLT
nr:MAG TPA: hypothetical protein [Caudoviricetes sp.]